MLNRSRSRSTSIPSVLKYEQWQIGDNPFNIVSYSYPGSTGKDETIHDEVHPHFAIRRRRNEVILGELLRDVHERTVVDGNHTRLNGELPNLWIGTRTGDFAERAESSFVYSDDALSAQDLQDVKDLAMINAYAKIRDNTIMSGEMMATLGQSLGMLRRPFLGTAKHLSTMFREARRSYKKTAASVSKANAGAWLEMRYGWSPLFQDFRNGFRLYADAEVRVAMQRRVVRASWKKQCIGSTANQDKSKPGDSYVLTGIRRREEAIAAHSGVIYNLGARTQAQVLSEKLRLGADSIASTVWELLPFSFVVDWFVAVGPWLEAVNLPPSVSILGNWTTSIHEITESFTVSELKRWNQAGTAFEYGTGGSSVIKDVRIHRTVNHLLPSHPPGGKLPGVIQMTDGLALLNGQVFGLLKKLRH